MSEVTLYLVVPLVPIAFVRDTFLTRKEGFDSLRVDILHSIEHVSHSDTAHPTRDPAGVPRS